MPFQTLLALIALVGFMAGLMRLSKDLFGLHLDAFILNIWNRELYSKNASCLYLLLAMSLLVCIVLTLVWFILFVVANQPGNGLRNLYAARLALVGGCSRCPRGARGDSDHLLAQPIVRYAKRNAGHKRHEANRCERRGHGIRISDRLPLGRCCTICLAIIPTWRLLDRGSRGGCRRLSISNIFLVECSNRIRCSNDGYNERLFDE